MIWFLHHKRANAAFKYASEAQGPKGNIVTLCVLCVLCGEKD